MDKKQALQVLANVCSNYRGTFEEHQHIQQAIATVGQIVNQEPKTEKKK